MQRENSVLAAPESRRDQRRRTLGIDCADRLLWKEWTPGSEYKRKIIVKNVDVHSQTISFRLPKNRTVFLTPYPEPITLSNGVSHEIEIRFCPAELVELHDALEITVKDRGSFLVHLDCLTPYAKLTIQPTYDFNYCSVQSTETVQVELRNSGTVPVEFKWEVDPPFRVSPSHAILDRDEVLHLTLMFTPVNACVAVALAVCRLSGTTDVIATIQISGIGKYPFVSFGSIPAAVAGAASTTAATTSPNVGSSTMKLGASGSRIATSNPSQSATTTTVSVVNNSTVRVQMKDACAGTLTTEEVVLQNPSPVTATISLHRIDDSVTCPFEVAPVGAIVAKDGSFSIPRGGSQRLRITCRADTSGVAYYNVFCVDCYAGNKLQLEVAGASVKPQVKLSLSHIDFGTVDLEDLSSSRQRKHTFTIRNTSAVEAHFECMNTSPGAAFLVEPQRGTVPPNGGTIRVSVLFRPSHPILYFRRLFLLVEGAADTLVVDVFGVAYHGDARPPALTLGDVDAAILRAQRGLGRAVPEQIDIIAAVAAELDRNPYETFTSPSRRVDPNTLELWRRTQEDAYGAAEIFRGQKRCVSTSIKALEDGIVSSTSLADSPFTIDAKPLHVFGSGLSNVQIVTIWNTSTSPAIATWSTPPRSPFTVVPEQQAIPPNSAIQFQVMWGGGRIGAVDTNINFATLECYVNYAQYHSFREASEVVVMPPQCFTICCSTTTEAQRTSAAAPLRVPANIDFPACMANSVSYQIVSFYNKSDVPVQYEVTSILLKNVVAAVMEEGMQQASALDYASGDETAIPVEDAGEESVGAVFAIHPPSGVLQPRRRHLIFMKFSPSDAAHYEADATLMLNNSTTGAMVVHLQGESCLPYVQWEGIGESSSGTLLLRPTCVSGETEHKGWLVNKTPLPISFDFGVSNDLLSVLRMVPTQGVLQRWERCRVAFLFSPQQPRVYNGSMHLHLSMGMSNELSEIRVRENPTRSTKTSQILYITSKHVHGEGAYGCVEVEPRLLDTADVTGLEMQHNAITVYNSGLCDVQYDVRCFARKETAKDWSRAESAAPQLQNSRGVLPARTHTVVLLSVQPTAGLSEYIFYVMISGIGTDLAAVQGATSADEAEKHPHCLWRLKGTRPAVQVVDVQTAGTPRALLWQQLSINDINEQLGGAAQPISTSATGFSFQHYVNGLTPVAVDLGMGHVGDPPIHISLLLENAGDCPASYQVMLPVDHDAHTEHWCLENEELEDLQDLIDRGIIAVSPRYGLIAVGGRAEITLQYHREIAGIHRLPVLLRVEDGRRVIMMLEGRTLPTHVQALSLFNQKEYTLMPVALGDTEPPLQSVTVMNPGPSPVDYYIDLDALQNHALEHYGFPIFQCVDPRGTIAAHTTVSIGFYFRPLEAREYRVRVVLQAVEGESYCLDLVGCGYHPRKATRMEVRQWIVRGLLHLPAAPLPDGRTASLRRDVILSEDVWQLGAQPYFTVCRRTCSIHNRNTKKAVHFSWNIGDTALHGGYMVAVEPATGVVEPGQELECRFTLYSGNSSQIIQWPLRCDIITDTSKSGTNSAAALAQCGSEHPSRSTRRATLNLSNEVSNAHALSLFIQARVMPIENYEDIFGRSKLETTYMPALYTDPTASIVGERMSRQEAGVLHSIMDEMLRTVLMAPAVDTAFHAPHAPKSIYYATMRSATAMEHGSHGRSNSASMPSKDPTVFGHTLRPSLHGSADDGGSVIAVEGLLEGLIRDVLDSCIAAK